MLFFFVKHKTAYELRISDWSSDVCSSDLLNVLVVVDLAVDGQDHRAVLVHHRLPALLRQVENAEPAMTDIDVAADPFAPLVRPPMRQSGDRKSVVSGKSVSVRVDPGGRRQLKKKNKHKVNNKRTLV